MNCIYFAPTALVRELVVGAYQSMVCPDTPLLSLVIVESWASDLVRDRFEAHPDIIELPPWDANKPVPAGLVAAFASDKTARVSAADTVGSALWKIRAGWPAARY